MKKFFTFWITKGKWRDRIILFTLFLLTSFLLFMIGTSIYIRVVLNKMCNDAEKRYHKEECMLAMTDQLEDNSASLTDRNSAIWALGQLGDKAALPVLEQYYEGGEKECNHETELCQYELEKAIKLIESGKNITLLVSKYFL